MRIKKTVIVEVEVCDLCGLETEAYHASRKCVACGKEICRPT